MQRETLGSRLGFILLSAGCAIGIGNVWKFPYMVGQHGGGAFVLIYLFFLLVMGVPTLTMEFAMGRAARKSPVLLYQQLEKPGHKWHVHGGVAMIGNWLLMMFYTVVSGWMLHYFVTMATGGFEGADVARVKAIMDEMLASPGTLVFYMVITVVMGFLVCSLGVQRITKWMMLALLVIMVVLAANSVFLPGAEAGLTFYLKPDLDRLREVGLGNTIVGAMNQSFFTLSLGIGSMAIFGSYLEKKRSLMGEAVNVAVLDTFVAFTSGLIIFPACFAYGVQPDSGPNLIFITLPNIFNNIPMGRLWGSLFFVFLAFAALSTVLAVFENIIACTMDLFPISRRKACIVCCVLMILLSLPCALGFNLLSGVQPMGAGSTIMDLEDFIGSNLLLPGGSLVMVLFCVSRYGWGWENFLREANEGMGLKVARWMRPYMTFVLPALVLVILIMGLV